MAERHDPVSPPGGLDRPPLRRRTVLGGLGSALLLAPMAGCRPWLRPDARRELASPHQRATVAAMTETFLPADDRSPGAREVDALAVVLDPAQPVAGYVSEVVADLDDWCWVAHGGRAFVELASGERELALEQRMGLHGATARSWYLPVYEGVLALTKLAFFGGVRRTAGTIYVGFPGPSAGYAADSAAGVHVGAGTTMAVTGPGKVTVARLTALVTGVDTERPRLVLTSPDGRDHEIIGPPGLSGTLTVDDQRIVSVAGGAAAGTWRLAAPPGTVVTSWWLALRTDLDEPGVGGRG